MKYDIVIVGGGASGLTAAIFAKRRAPERSVAVLERMDRVGKKLLATGNGRCNLTNRALAPERYHGGAPEVRESVLARFGVREAEAFFGALGVLFYTGEAGKVYPYSRQASSVLDALRFCCARLGVELLCAREVTALRRAGDGFALRAGGEELGARAVVVAAGGKAAEALGSNGSGYGLLAGFGHTVTPLYPALTPIRTETAPIRALKGIKVDARVTLRAGAAVREETGEVLFAEYGLSGPPILQLSRLAAESCGAKGAAISLDLMPEYGFAEVDALLRERSARLPELTLEDFFTGLLHKRVGQAAAKSAGLPLSARAGGLSARERKALAARIKGFPLRVTGVQGFAQAQVTAGGVRLSEFAPETLASRRARGLFACGEVLDVDGDCGGFNLHWAWASGSAAGTAAAEAVESSAAR